MRHDLVTRSHVALLPGILLLQLGANGTSWAAGIAVGLGASALVYGCGCYARAKGHTAVVGCVLGATWVVGTLVFSRAPWAAASGAALAIASLIGLVLLRDRTRSATA